MPFPGMNVTNRIADMKEIIAPNINGVVEPNNCHKVLTIKLAGNAASPIAVCSILRQLSVLGFSHFVDSSASFSILDSLV